MGAYSTVHVSRADAIDQIKDKLEEASNEQLAEIMFDLFRYERLNNYDVVDKLEDWHIEWNKGRL